MTAPGPPVMAKVYIFKTSKNLDTPVRKIFFLSTISLLTAVGAHAQCEKISGVWLNEQKTATFKIYKQNDCYIGIVSRTDDPDNKLVVNQLVIKNLSCNNGSYTGGSAYTARFGWVDCEAELKDANTLLIKGSSMGFSRTRTFTRVSQ